MSGLQVIGLFLYVLVGATYTAILLLEGGLSTFRVKHLFLFTLFFAPSLLVILLYLFSFTISAIGLYVIDFFKDSDIMNKVIYDFSKKKKTVNKNLYGLTSKKYPRLIQNLSSSYLKRVILENNDDFVVMSRVPFYVDNYYAVIKCENKPRNLPFFEMYWEEIDESKHS